MSTQVTAPSTTAAPSRMQLRVPLLFSFHAVLAAFIVILVFIVMRQDTADPDLWWHLKNAEYLVQHHTFAFHDVYSFTARGQACVPHEWIGELLFYAAFRTAGLQGVWAVSFALCALIFVGVLYLGYRASGDIKNSMLVTIIGVMLGKISFGPRTLLLGWLYLIVLLVVLEQLRRNRTAALWALPPLFLLWVNSHGSWILGLALFLLFVACGYFEHSWPQVDAVAYSRPHLSKLITIAALSIAAVFLNPSGLRIVLYPLDLKFKQTVNVGSVEEWQSINFHQANGVLLLAVILCVIALMLFSRVRWNLQEVVFLFVALYMSTTYVRMLFLAGILIPPILARRIKLFSEYDSESENQYVNAGVLLACVVVLLTFFPKKIQLERNVNAMFPITAIEHIKTHPANGNLFHEYLWGGYLIWKDVPVFIDGRADIYDHNGVFSEYMQAITLNNSLAVLNKYRIDQALLGSNSPLAYLLSQNAGWSIEYKDEKCVLFRRNTPSVMF